MTKTKACYDMILAALKRNPNVEYDALRKKAQAKGYKIYPIMYGRAKRALGLVGKDAKPVRKVTRKKRVATKNGHTSLTDQIKEVVNENKRLRAQLEKVRDLVG